MTTWATILLVAFLVPLALRFTAEAFYRYHVALLDREITLYLRYCQERGIMVQDSFYQILGKER